MRSICLIFLSATLAWAQPTKPAPAAVPTPAPALPLTAAAPSSDEAVLRRIYAEELTHGQAYENLRTLVSSTPGRLSGSKSLERAVTWAQKTLTAIAPDRVYLQDVMVPHWERGEPEAVIMVTSGHAAELLSAVALGNSVPTPKDGLIADVIEVKSLDELKALSSAQVSGKIVFFNRPMDPATLNPGAAYGAAGDQRNQGPALAASLGAVAALTRSLTQAHDDIPHTGNTAYKPEGPNVPAAALSTIAADNFPRRSRGG